VEVLVIPNFLCSTDPLLYCSIPTLSEWSQRDASETFLFRHPSLGSRDFRLNSGHNYRYRQIFRGKLDVAEVLILEWSGRRLFTSWTSIRSLAQDSVLPFDFRVLQKIDKEHLLDVNSA